MISSMKPCPKCKEYPYMETYGYAHQVVCKKCGYYGAIGFNLKEAVDFWNRKASEKQWI